MQDNSRFMASRRSLIIYATCSLIFLFNSFMKLATGQLLLATCDIIVVLLSAVATYRLLKIPVFSFDGQTIEICNRPLLAPKVIRYSEIIKIEKSGRTGFQLSLSNAKPLKLPLQLIQTSEREVVISHINDLLKTPISA